MNWNSAPLLMALLALAGTADRTACRAADGGGDIQFSEPTRKIDLPAQVEIDRPQAARLEFLDRGNSLGGVVEGGFLPASPSSPASNPRLMEFFNRQLGERRWRVDKDEPSDSAAAFEKAVGVNSFWSSRSTPPSANRQPFSLSDDDAFRNPALGPNDRNPATRDRAFRNTTANKSTGSLSGVDSLSNPGGRDIETSPGSFELNRPLAAGVVLPSGLWGTSSSAPRPGVTPAAPTGLTGLNLPNPTQTDRRPDSLRSILAATGGINPLAAGFDPINLNVDMTRQAVNPVVPVAAPRLSVNPTKNPLLESPEARLERSRASESQALDIRIEALGSSSLSPSISAPAAPPVSRPFVPGPMRFPDRKF